MNRAELSELIGLIVLDYPSFFKTQDAKEKRIGYWSKSLDKMSLDDAKNIYQGWKLRNHARPPMDTDFLKATGEITADQTHPSQRQYTGNIKNYHFFTVGCGPSWQRCVKKPSLCPFACLTKDECEDVLFKGMEHLTRELTFHELDIVNRDRKADGLHELRKVVTIWNGVSFDKLVVTNEQELAEVNKYASEMQVKYPVPREIQAYTKPGEIVKRVTKGETYAALAEFGGELRPKNEQAVPDLVGAEENF